MKWNVLTKKLYLSQDINNKKNKTGMGETSSCVAKINIQKRKMCLKFQHLLLRGKR